MKFGKTQLHLGHLISVFMAFVIGLSFSYVGVSTYTHLLEAKGLDILSFLSVEKLTPPLTCPQLKEVVTPTGTRILKDECSGTYWYSMDLPILNKNDQFLGYTWQEAKDSCENLAKVTLSDSATPFNVFRLPTVDELLTLANIPCTQAEGCSPITRLNATMSGTASGSTVNVTTSSAYFYKKQFRALANGSYWAVNEMNANSAASVNLQIGTVNNPALGKSLQLNVRCVYNTPISLNVGGLTNPGDQVFWQAGTAAGRSKIIYRSNIQKATLTDCPAPFNTNNTVNTQCTGVSSDTNKNIIFACAGTDKPYRRQVCSNSAITECVDNSPCGSGTCVFDSAQPIGCKPIDACFTGYKYYVSKTCSNEPARDCRTASDCSQTSKQCSVSKATCAVTGDCGATGGTCGVTCDTLDGECLNEKLHMCQPPTTTSPAVVRVLDLAVDHVAYNPFNEYGQTWNGTIWTPVEDWTTEYNNTASNPEAKDCRFKAAPGYFYDAALGRGINERAWECTNLPSNSVWNVTGTGCSNDNNKACTVGTQESDCGVGNTCATLTGKYHQYFDNNAWSPASTSASYSETPSTDSCVFKSVNTTQWAWDGSQMTSFNRTWSCSAKPTSSSAWWTSGSYSQSWNYFTPVPTDNSTTGEYTPQGWSTVYSASNGTNLCDYHCTPDSKSQINCATPATGYKFSGTGKITYTLNTSDCSFTTNSNCALICDLGYKAASNGNCYLNPETTEVWPSWNGYYLTCDEATADAYCDSAWISPSNFYTADILNGASCATLKTKSTGATDTNNYTVTTGSSLGTTTIHGNDYIIKNVQCYNP